MAGYIFVSECNDKLFIVAVFRGDTISLAKVQQHGE